MVWKGSVEQIIFADSWFDAVTNFETVYFWPDLPQCFREIYRVLKLGGRFLICNECSGDTSKDDHWTQHPRHDHILAVPISFKKLLTKKLIVCGVLSIIFGLICSLFTIIAEMIVRFPGFKISLALKATLQITAVNFFLYLAVLPIIALTCRRAGSILVGVIIAFVYGYGGMFASGNMTLASLYPITASLGMVGYRSYDSINHANAVVVVAQTNQSGSNIGSKYLTGKGDDTFHHLAFHKILSHRHINTVPGAAICHDSYSFSIFSEQIVKQGVKHAIRRCCRPVASSIAHIF